MKIKGFDIKDDISEFEKQINEFLTGVTMKDIVVEKHTTTHEVSRYNTVTETWYKAVIKYEESVQRIIKVKLFNKKPFLEMITDAQAFMDTVNVIDVKFFMPSDDDNKFVIVIYDENRGKISEGAEMGIEFFKGTNIEALNNEIGVFAGKFLVNGVQVAGYKNEINVMLNYVQSDSMNDKVKVFFGSADTVVNEVNNLMPDIILHNIDYMDCDDSQYAIVLNYSERTDGIKSSAKIRWFGSADKPESIRSMNEFINSGVKIFNIRMKNVFQWYSVLFVYED